MNEVVPRCGTYPGLSTVIVEPEPVTNSLLMNSDVDWPYSQLLGRVIRELEDIVEINC